MIIENFKPFEGQHCETTATGTLLKNLEIELSEPMLFGLGQGLSFIYWNAKNMGMPFLGGRVKPEQITINLCNNLGLTLEMKETSSLNKAWENVQNYVDKGIPVGLKLDCYHLDYFSRKFHFAAHYVAIYGNDNEFAFLVDTAQQGSVVKTKLDNLAKARNEKGPMSSRNLSYIIRSNLNDVSLKNAAFLAIKQNTNDYLNPAISNFTYRGIAKASKELLKWYKTSANAVEDFKTIGILMEKGGTGGALFRNLYRDFLKESAEICDSEAIHSCYEDCKEIASNWNKVSGLFDIATESSIHEASKLMLMIANKEKHMMQKLSNV